MPATTRVLVQRHAHRHALAQVWSQFVKLSAQETHERRHVERRLAGCPLKRRQHVFGKLNETAWAPSQHLAGLGLREFMEGIAGNARGGVEVAGAELNDAAAVRWSTHHPIADAELVQNIEAQERDVGLLSTLHPVKNTTSGSSSEAGRLVGFWPRRSNASSDSCSRDSTPTSSASLRKFCTACLRRSGASLTRATARRKRGLTS